MKLTEKLFNDTFSANVYSERFLNDSKGRFEDYSEVNPQYDPQGGIAHVDLPYCVLPPERCVVLQSTPQAELLSWVKMPEGYKFFWHPDVVRRELMQVGVVRTQPTSSTRTLLTEALPHVYIKTDLDRKHFRFVRRLQRTSVEHSVAVCGDLRNFTTSLPHLTRWAFLPESIGVTIRGGEHEGSGVIYRETVPHPVVKREHLLIPYHALYAYDPNVPEDKPILVQLVERNAQFSPIEYFVHEIVGPILEAWTTLVSKRGLLPELHGQNALAEIDRDFRLCRVVYRDFQGTYSDSQIRINNGLPVFIKHVVGTETGTTVEAQYSHVFDGMIGRYLLSRLTKTFCAHFSTSYATITAAIRDYHRNLASFGVAKFPETVFGFATSAREQTGNEVTFVDTGEVPEFR